MLGQSIRVHTVTCTCKQVYLGYSVTTCDEPLHAEIGLKTLNNRRDFNELKWHCKLMCMNDERLPFKLLSNEWNKMKCMSCPRISWAA